MAEFHGKRGLVTLTTATYNLVIALRQWQVRSSVEVVKTAVLATAAGQKNKAAYGGYNEYSGSFEGYIVSGSKADFDACDGAAATATFTAGDQTTYVGQIIISSLEVTNAVDDVGKLSCTFEVDGDFD